MMPEVETALNLIFRNARTFPGWLEKPVDPALLREVYDLAKMGPTSMNMSPLRIVFVTTPEGKEKLKPALMEGNVAKTMSAPVTAIFAHDLKFYDHMGKLWPFFDAKPMFANNAHLAEVSAFRNGTLQAAYFMMAARAKGLDLGPMSGFDNGKVDEAFFAGTAIKSNFLCNIGYGDASKLYPRGPRLEFDEVARVE